MLRALGSLLGATFKVGGHLLPIALWYGPSIYATAQRYFKPPTGGKQYRPYGKKLGSGDIYWTYYYKPGHEKRWVSFVGNPSSYGWMFNNYYWSKLTPGERLQLVRRGVVDRYYVFSPDQALPEHIALLKGNKKIRDKFIKNFGQKYYQELVKPKYKVVDKTKKIQNPVPPKPAVNQNT